MFVGVAGLIGAGKSTLTKDLSRVLAERSGKPWKSKFEPVEENPYLEDFYLDIPRWTFNMQMFLLSSRFKQHQQVLWDSAHEEGGGIVQDRTIYEDTIFASMHHDDGVMIGRDWQTYIDHFHLMQGFLRYPDLIIYLRVSPETALRRLQVRARSEEQGNVPLAYLEGLFKGYEKFVEEISTFVTVMTLDWEEFQPIEGVADRVLQVQAEARSSNRFSRSLLRL